MRLYDKKLNLIAQSREGLVGLTPSLPYFLYEQAKSRKGAECLKVISGLWSSSQGAVYSVLVPVGGLRLRGYLEIVANPVHNMGRIAEITELPLMVTALDGAQLMRTENWETQQSDSSLAIDFSLLGEDGNTALVLHMLEDMGPFFKTIQQTQLMVIIGLVVLLAAVITTSLWFFSRHLFRPLQGLVENMASCAEGDLTRQVDSHGLKELNVLANALSQLINGLKSQVTSIRSNADQVATSAHKLSSIIEQVSAAIAQQHQQTDEVAQAAAQLSSTNEEVVASAVQCAESAHAADVMAQEGKVIVSDSIAAIDAVATEFERAGDVIRRVETDSKNVGGVLQVIQGIAEQTNLLALKCRH